MGVYAYSGANPLVQCLSRPNGNASNVVVNEYTWGLNLGGGIEGLLNLNSAGQNYAYLYDGKGNIEAVLNASQQVVAAYRYDPFGVLLAKTGSFEQPYGFSTKRVNDQTGLVDFGRRWYDPGSARWTTRDPLGEAGGLNLYAFVGNNPVNWVDPWGLEWNYGSPQAQETFKPLIQKNPILQAIVTILDERDSTYTLLEFPRGAEDYISRAITFQRRKGDPVIIGIDPTYLPDIEAATIVPPIAGKVCTSTERILAHEVAHAFLHVGNGGHVPVIILENLIMFPFDGYIRYSEWVSE